MKSCLPRFPSRWSLSCAWACLRVVSARLLPGGWLLLCTLTFLGFAAQAQPPVTTLSPDAQVSVLTCAPGSELYSVFGHSALRIQDPATRLDWVWNYGVFEFDTPNFVLKFAQGKLLYYVLSYSYRHFHKEYEAEGRSIHEQTLALTEGQKKAIFDALLVNELPDNKYYQYDFFYDNCATRERDVLMNALGADLRFHPRQPDDYGSYRTLIDGYLRNDVWADFGIDLVLGSLTDKTASQQGAMFLPDHLHGAVATAEVRVDGQWRPLVQRSQTLLELPVRPVTAFQYGPHILGWSIFALAVFVTFLGFKGGKAFKLFDCVLFLVLGLLGVLLLLFWVATDHQATYWNLNLLWAVPPHAVFAFAYVIPRMKRISLRYTKVMLPWTLGFLALSWLLPQGFHAAIFPIVMAAALRLAWIWHYHRKG